jgi:hemolysin III
MENFHCIHQQACQENSEYTPKQTISLDSTEKILVEQIDLNDEWANSLTHGIGFLLSVIGCFFLISLSVQQNDYSKIISFLVYGSSLVILYASSTLYHLFRSFNLKRIFRIIDHCAIYILIAGSYTPFTMLTLKGTLGWSLFGIIWGLTILGIVFKIFFTHRFQIFSTCIYLIMGWLVIIALKPLMTALPYLGLVGLFAGGLCYTLGIVFFALDKKRFYHAIWHLFVMGGSACHYFTVLLYL